ncbi:hypothetical protein AHAS_Ahas15G0369300 [Arachis hypogaea]
MAQNSPFSYDVFISFRGQDTRYSFTGYLYKQLCNNRIRTFFDDEELQSGERITPSLVKAIQESRIAIIVLSANYAASSSCLEELVHILHCIKGNNRRVLLPVTDYTVGLESRVSKVISLLEMDSGDGVLMVGIHGIGGIGKTTLALALYNSIAYHFDGMCFLENVRENSQKYGLVLLQNSLLCKILGKEEVQIVGVKEGSSQIQQRLRQKRVLLILDDIDEYEQLKAIAGKPDWFGRGSRIIITTRNKHLLTLHDIEKTYEVQGLNKEESLDLLIWKAFKTDIVSPRYVNVLTRAVSYASGLPLALEVIGSNLFGKEVEHWESALHQYEKIPKRKIQQILKISYDALEEYEKNIFLDITCCLKGQNLIEIRDILHAHYGDNMRYHIQRFRGQDTRYSFTGNLYKALCDKGILTFFDDGELQSGEEITPALLKAIQESRIAIVVLSPNYASSSFCLDELVHVLHCIKGNHRLVLPVFYEIRRRSALPVADHPVGLDSPVSKVASLLDVESSAGVHMVGIYGIGGIGKTTLALAVYNLIADNFDGLCFLENVRENSNRHGIVHLQNILLSEILEKKKIKLSSSKQGTSEIQKRLCQIKVLLVLDDVDEQEQLKAIAGKPDWFGHGSRIIITTRDKHLLTLHDIGRTYAVQGLNAEGSLDLLQWKAFKTDIVNPRYENVLARAVTYASGLPLALEVIGFNLFGKDLEQWKSAMDQYEKVLDNKIRKILQVSFDVLGEDVQSVFLDIACCFKGYKSVEVTAILQAHYGREKLSILKLPEYLYMLPKLDSLSK